MTASVGLTLLRPGITEPQLHFQAGSAAYEAKAQGRNKLTHFELIQDSGATGPEADLQRFQKITRMRDGSDPCRGGCRASTVVSD